MYTSSNFYMIDSNTFSVLQPASSSSSNSSANMTQEAPLIVTGFYEGKVVKNKLHGRGKLIDTKGDIYEGNFVEGKPDNRGKYIHHDTYLVPLVINLACLILIRNVLEKRENSVIDYRNGDCYEGDVVNGKQYGKGKWIKKNGVIYDRAPEDRASHAYGMRRTKRNEVMYQTGGVCYVYLCYGLHALFNIVTNQKDVPHAILIRAIEPLIGIETMLARRHKQKMDRNLTSGPSTLTQALGINQSHNGLSLVSSQIWIEDRGFQVKEEDIIHPPRVGVDYAGEDALLPWRFRLKSL